jgi:hypothetical protein
MTTLPEVTAGSLANSRAVKTLRTFEMLYRSSWATKFFGSSRASMIGPGAFCSWNLAQ